MPTNETVVEVVRFTEKGISEVTARTKVMGNQIDEATKRQKILLGLLNDSRYSGHVQKLDTINKGYELMGLKLRNVAMAHSLADGSAARQMRSVEKLNQQYERMRREAELIAKYGETTGRFLSRHGAALSGLGRIGGGMFTAGAGLSAAMSRQGFQGTVEQARFEAAQHRLSREFAGVNKPIMDSGTMMMNWLTKRMEKMGPASQNLLMGAGLLGAGYGGYRVLGLLRGLGGAATSSGSGALGPAAMSRLAEAGSPAAAGAGRTSLLSRAGGLASRASGPFAVGSAVADSAYDIYSDPSTWRGLGRQSVRGLDWLYGGEGARLLGFKSGSVLGQGYDALFGENEARSGAGGVARGVAGGEPRTGGPNPDRRKVMLAGGGYEEAGSGGDRLDAAIARMQGEVGASEAQEPAWARKLGVAIDTLINVFERQFGPPLPRPNNE
jgi:hypothetical protein